MKKKYEDLQVAYKGDEIKHLKELYMARVSQVSQKVLATMKSSEGSSDTRPRTRVQELCASRGPEALDLRASRGARGSSADTTDCFQSKEHDIGPF